MPNGFQGSKEKWDKLEAPLVKLDKKLKDFANEYNIKIEKNYHSEPNRILSWGKKIKGQILQINKQQGTS